MPCVKRLLVLFKDIDRNTPEGDLVLMLLLIRKVLTRVIATADIIITSCWLAGIDNLLFNFRSKVTIIDDCNMTLEGEAMIPV